MRTRLRRGGRDEDLTTGNVLGAYFDHATARPEAGMPPDPHRHKHVLFFNATFNPDEKRIKAAQFGAIVRDRAYYEAAFYSPAGREARRDGLRDRPPRRQGVGDRRGAAIGDRQVLASGRSGSRPRPRSWASPMPGRKAELAGKTRSKKQKGLTTTELRQAWDAQLTDAERRSLDAVYRKEIAPVRGSHGGRGRDLRDRPLLGAALGGAGAGVEAGGVAARAGAASRRNRSRPSCRGTASSSARSTAGGWRPRKGCNARSDSSPASPPTAAARCTGRRAGRSDPHARRTASGSTTASGKSSPACSNSSNRVDLVQGPAGAGKSFALRKFDEAMRLAGRSRHLSGGQHRRGGRAGQGRLRRRIRWPASCVDEKMQAAAQGGRVVVDEISACWGTRTRSPAVRPGREARPEAGLRRRPDAARLGQPRGA